MCSNFSSLKLENGLKKHIQNAAEIKCGSVKLVVIFFTFCKMWSFSDYEFSIQWLSNEILQHDIFCNSHNLQLKLILPYVLNTVKTWKSNLASYFVDMMLLLDFSASLFLYYVHYIFSNKMVIKTLWKQRFSNYKTRVNKSLNILSSNSKKNTNFHDK